VNPVCQGREQRRLVYQNFSRREPRFAAASVPCSIPSGDSILSRIRRSVIAIIFFSPTNRRHSLCMWWRYVTSAAVHKQNTTSVELPVRIYEK
jgi:hypothetical protein